MYSLKTEFESSCTFLFSLQQQTSTCTRRAVPHLNTFTHSLTHLLQNLHTTTNMGGAASITSSDSSSPDVHLVDFTDREQFLRDCSVFFDTMQSSDGTAAKHRIYSVLNGLHQASEILNVFLVSEEVSEKVSE
jgi:hypothetical protein